MSEEQFEHRHTTYDESICVRLKELEHKIDYHFNNFDWLKKAFYVKIIGTSNEAKYANSSLATLGDVVIGLIIAERLYDCGVSSFEITDGKSKTVDNISFKKLSDYYKLYSYAFNDEASFDKAEQSQGKPNSIGKLPHSKHDNYFEALIGAIYKDSGIDSVKSFYDRTLEAIKNENN